ncbi:unnamed protein product [Rotaria sp. Silwood1]|nr:unnamed protein product [Rotaria sp. Silwood1]CAF3489457.1 unnamed protein product [Rotaria sp. Silwood1]CAF3504466.1 unnamed protein product [Rotaria sp. Silwood1]CAF4641622.1 unnamed protein product [Rotaria sp. Silwood1]CAF4651853.1 unnamed protein product [Rotaria sp. Silwood1]
MSSCSVPIRRKNTVVEKVLMCNYDLSDNYDVIIRFHSAKILSRNVLGGHPDPYFIANIDHVISFKSIALPRTLEPSWYDAEWIVRNISRHAELIVTLYDKYDRKLSDDFIGQFIIRDLINYIPSTKGHDIINASNQYNGCFHLSIQSMKSSEETKQLPRYTLDSSCRYFCHNSMTMGRLTKINIDHTYPTWKIQMRRISFFFLPNQRQYWNKQYKSARAIFGNYPFSSTSRKSIKLAHKALYEKTSRYNENGSLNSSDDLWKFVFTNRITKIIKPCIYTYVIDNYSWKFSETGIGLFTDFVSKHALLANCSEYVCYAGEFHPRPKYGWDKWDDEWELVFDNNSRTYAPDANLLINLKQLLVFNFPGLNIVTYDCEDPKLQDSKEALTLAAQKYQNSLVTSQ